jgi:hypothetical protein
MTIVRMQAAGPCTDDTPEGCKLSALLLSRGDARLAR